jgi:prepilin-type N-terminal cleavage/methylation domain-containing protein
MSAPVVRGLRALARRVGRNEGGYSLVELVVTVAILGTVMTAVSVLFEGGIHAQTDMDARFQSQVNLNIAVGKLRREAHGACGLAAGNTTSSITLNLPATGTPPQPPATPCTPSVVIPITWCTIGSGFRYKLYRVAGSTCTVTNAKQYADYIKQSAVFTSFTALDLAKSSLARLHIHFPVNLKANGSPNSVYTIDDDIVFRNSGT